MFKKLLLSCSIIFSCSNLLTFDNPHFYRATNFFSFYNEPRLEKPWLASFDATLGYGSTKESRDSCSQKVALLNIYGFHNMVKLGCGVPCKDPTNAQDVILSQLSLLPCRCNFGQLAFCSAEFSIIESYLAYTQNLNRGLFFQFILPIRRMKIDNIFPFTDLSPCDQLCPNKHTFEWQAFLNNFCSIMNRYCLCLNSFEQTGVGDLAIIGGWTLNYQDTNVLDYIDLTFRTGVLVPTGKEKDINQPFSLPLGYNGHVGIPIRFNFAFGAYDWLTFGGYLGGIAFASKKKCVRLKTNPSQCGFIKLAKGVAKISKGCIWDASIFFKGDHFIQGFSFLIGYSYVTKRDDTIEPCDKCFDGTIATCDPEALSWKMHTLQFAVEYDFTKPNARFGPRLGAFFNWQVGGQRVFKTNMGGGTFGLEINWSY